MLNEGDLNLYLHWRSFNTKRYVIPTNSLILIRTVHNCVLKEVKKKYKQIIIAVHVDHDIVGNCS